MEYVEREAVIAKSHGGVVYIDDIKNIPSADVAPVRHAMWVPYHDSDFGWDEYGYKCSDCNYRVERDEFTFAENFCPLCGAKMDLEG